MQTKGSDLPRYCTGIDAFIERLGSAICWLNSILVINIVVQVILRYVLGEGKVWLEELEWHFYAVLFLVGLSYCLTTNTHVRLDIFQRKFSETKKEIIDLLGMIFLVLPFFSILVYHGLDFLATAWHVSESSPHPLGLPCWWFIKAFIPVTMFLVILAAFSRIVRSVVVLRRIKAEKRQR
jgi:TRAP-type mannitol/chloroaromatic compound transport system permease small subunit